MSRRHLFHRQPLRAVKRAARDHLSADGSSYIFHAKFFAVLHEPMTIERGHQATEFLLEGQIRVTRFFVPLGEFIGYAQILPTGEDWPRVFVENADVAGVEGAQNPVKAI